MVAREGSSIREDEQGKVVTAIGEVGKAERQTEHLVGAQKEEPDVCVKSFGLVGLEGEQHGRRIK